MFRANPNRALAGVISTPDRGDSAPQNLCAAIRIRRSQEMNLCYNSERHGDFMNTGRLGAKQCDKSRLSRAAESRCLGFGAVFAGQVPAVQIHNGGLNRLPWCALVPKAGGQRQRSNSSGGEVT
jgi:hypothetical protein